MDKAAKVTAAERPEIVSDDHLEYLDALRASGATNMFGAVPYLVEEFDLTRTASSVILKYWMASFGKRNPPKAAS